VATDSIYHKVERVIDYAIPVATVALIIVIVASFLTNLEQYEPIPTIVDYSILAIFLLDLGFKWNHVRKLKKFVKLYWLDIIAVFPFYLLTRSFFAATQLLGGELPGEVLHTLTGLKETEVLREAEAVRAARGVKLSQRVFRAVALRLRGEHHKIKRYAHKKHKKI